jgi:hypothetical protein
LPSNQSGLTEQHAELGVVDKRAVADLAKQLELGFPDARWRFIAVRREVDDEAFITRHLAACRLAKHRLGVGALAEQPHLIDEDEHPLLATDRLAVGRHHLEKRAGDPMRDLPQVILH